MTNRRRLNDRIADEATCPSGKSQAYIHDSVVPGLALRLRATGGKSWVYFFSMPGVRRSQRATIGPFPKVDTKAAREQAKIHAGQVALAKAGLGNDPNEEKREEKEARKRAARSKQETVGALIAVDGPYEASLQARSYKNKAQALSALRRNLLPDHKATAVAKLTRLDITNAMDRLTAKGLPGASADLRRRVKTFLLWCTNKGLTTHNVMDGYRKPKETRAEKLGRKAKGRVLTGDEIRAVWHACAKQGTFGLLVRLALLGGARRSEPARIEWGRNVMADRVTFDAAWTKMGLHHDIPRTVTTCSTMPSALCAQPATSCFRRGGRTARASAASRN